MKAPSSGMEKNCGLRLRAAKEASQGSGASWVKLGLKVRFRGRIKGHTGNVSDHHTKPPLRTSRAPARSRSNRVRRLNKHGQHDEPAQSLASSNRAACESLQANLHMSTTSIARRSCSHSDGRNDGQIGGYSRRSRRTECERREIP